MIHIIPFDDLIGHVPDGSCCNPHKDGVDELMIHHSADKREQFERQGKFGKGWLTVAVDEATGLFITAE